LCIFRIFEPKLILEAPIPSSSPAEAKNVSVSSSGCLEPENPILTQDSDNDEISDNPELSDTAENSFSSSGSEFDECKDSIEKVEYGLQVGDWTKKFLNTPPYLDQSDERYRISISTRAENRDKNRYIDIMPYDNTRFIFSNHPAAHLAAAAAAEGLSTTPGGYFDRIGGFFKHIIQGNDQSAPNPGGGTDGGQLAGQLAGSDYINANYVNMNGGNGNIRRWIAAQGPLQLTVNDFWRMVYER